MALQIPEITESIAALSVTGLTIRDVYDIPIKIDRPTLFPLDDFIAIEELVMDSFGSGDTAEMTFIYRLNYRLCYKPIGTGRNLEVVGDLVEMIAAILDAIIGIVNITGAVEIAPANNIRMGVVADPAGTSWFGCDFSFRVKEFIH